MSTFAVLTWTIAISALGLSAALWVAGLHRVRTWRLLLRRGPEPSAWPNVHVIVCLKGSLPDLRSTVLALDLQDYPGEYGVTFVTEDTAANGDEAAAAVARVLPLARRCAHEVAGRVVDSAFRCAQKNFNLLAGIRDAETRNPGAEVWAFCDGDLLVRPGWLREMVRPIASGRSDATTSLHYATSTGPRLVGALHGMAESAQSAASLVFRGSTWGGSTAIRRGAFHRLGLAEVWSNTCVDDVTMSQVLRKSRIRVTPVPQFLVSGRSEIGGYWSFVRWLGRQFFFVKVYQRSRWHLLWVKCALDLVAIWLAAYQVSHRVVRGEWPVSLEAAIVTLAAGAAALGTFHVLRYFLPVPPPRRAWLGATLLAPGAGLLACADATLRRKRLTWRDLTYDLGPDGRVAHVTDRSRPAASPVDEPVAEEALA